MTISWADALKRATNELVNNTLKAGGGCHLCGKCDWDCYRCIVDDPICHAMNEEWKYCWDWSDAIRDGNKNALRRARQLEAYVRKHPRSWMHMEPADLAREVKKETP